MNNKSVLYINAYAADHKGGFIYSLLAIIKKLNEEGNRVSCIFPRSKDYTVELENYCEVYYLDSFIGKKLDYKLFRLVVRLVKDKNIDVIHTNFGLCGYITAVLVSGWFKQTKHISHSRAITFSKRGDGFLKRLKAQVFFKPLTLWGGTQYIAISSEVKRSLMQYNGINENRIVLIPNAVELHSCGDEQLSMINVINEFKQFIQNQFVFCMVAHIGPMKDHFTLIRAAKRLKDTGKIFKIVLIGSTMVNKGDSHLLKIKTAISDAGLDECFYFTGEIPNPSYLLPYINVGLLISNYEGFGNAVVEYMLHKKPVIASKVGGLMDVVHNEVSGFLVEKQNDDELYRYMKVLMEDSDLASSMGSIGYSKASSLYKIDHWVDRVINLYENQVGS